MLLKIVCAVIAVLVLFFIAGITGFLFTIWPTAWPDEKLAVTPSQLERLHALQQEPKFIQDSSLSYPGALNEELRVTLEAMMNAAIAQISQGLPTQPKKSFVLDVFKSVMARTRTLDTEERDRLAEYFMQIMDILGIRSSNQLLNVWHYGLPYDWFPLDK